MRNCHSFLGAALFSDYLPSASCRLLSQQSGLSPGEADSVHRWYLQFPCPYLVSQAVIISSGLRLVSFFFLMVYFAKKESVQLLQTIVGLMCINKELEMCVFCVDDKET